MSLLSDTIYYVKGRIEHSSSDFVVKELLVRMNQIY